MNEEFDVLIVGGGMVGATVACALGGSELKVGLVEQSMPEAFSAEQPHDMRVSALSIASKTILESVGAWKTVINMRSCPFKRMRVWETAGDTEFNSDAIGYDALGYIVENRVTQLALLRRAKEFSNVQLLCPASIKKIHYAAGRGSVELDDGRSLSAKVMVGADGGQSRVRQTVGLGVTSWDYQQHAMVINVETDYEPCPAKGLIICAASPTKATPCLTYSCACCRYNYCVQQVSKKFIMQQVGAVLN
jgi:2-octaprenyl-3-methyl-6-methoxy-1,4-benzoquinol hydroxylase